MRIYPLSVAALLLIAVCGCSESDKASTRIPPPPQPKDNALFGTQLQSLDKAKGVEGTLQLESQRLKETIDQQETTSR